MSTNLLYFSLFIILLSPVLSKTQSKSSPDRDGLQLLRSSCVNASYPKICLRSLSSSRGAAAKTPRELAQLAVNVSLSRARKAEKFLSQVSGDGRRERQAVRDCIEQMSDSVDELRQTMAVLQHLRRRDSDFRWQMSNAETWMSAALSNEDTCLDGFREIDGRVRSDVRRRITNVARVTSNALYLITALDDSYGRKPAAP